MNRTEKRAYSISLDEATPEEAGGKGNLLRKVQEMGYIIPATFVLPAGRIESGREEMAEALVEEIPFAFPWIIRSSYALEGGIKKSFSGLFSSAISRDRIDLGAVIAKCAEMPEGDAWRRYSESLEELPTELSLLVQPLIQGRFAGVASYDPRTGIIDGEYPRNYNFNITSGQGSDGRFKACQEDKRFRLLEGDRKEISTFLQALGRTISHIGSHLYPGCPLVMEWTYGDPGEFTVLQVRPSSGLGAGSKKEAVKMDMEGRFESIHRAMSELGFSEEEWALGENLDILAFNYLDRIIREEWERTEHIKIWITSDGIRPDWKTAREGGDGTVFPVQLEDDPVISSLLEKGIFIIFYPGLEKRAVKKIASGDRTMQFTIPNAGMSPEEEQFHRSTLPRATWEMTRENCLMTSRNLSGNIGLIKEILDIVKDHEGTYEQELLSHLSLLMESEQRKRDLTDCFMDDYRTEDIIKGLPLSPRPGWLEGTVLTESDLASGEKRDGILVSRDLEPSLVIRLSGIKAVIVSRTTRSSHAAALCTELGIPLFIETNNISRLDSGKRIRIDLENGIITKLD